MDVAKSASGKINQNFSYFANCSQIRKIIMTRSKHSGFTLIEMMVTAAIIAILAAIALPSYQNSVRKSRRADAETNLLQDVQFMEKIYSENNTYMPSSANPTLPILISPTSGTKYYDITISASTATTYSLRATPVARTKHCTGIVSAAA